MDAINLSEYVMKLVKDRRNHILDMLSSDGVKNMEHYKELMELKSLLNKQERIDD